MTKALIPDTSEPVHLRRIAVVTSILGLSFILTVTAVSYLGRQPVIPVDFFTSLIAASLPFAFCFFVWQARSTALPRAVVRAAAPVVGLAGLFLFSSPAPWLLGAVATAAFVRGRVPIKVRPGVLVLAALGLLLGYGAVWNANLLVASGVYERLQDPLLRYYDTRMYAALGIDVSSYRSVFPLLRHPLLLTLFENAYLIVLPEVVLVLFLLVHEDWKQVSTFLVTIFSGYAAGLLVFLAFPGVGPCIYYPESLSSALDNTSTLAIMKAMASGFAQVQGGGGGRVVAYFVAFPSLHVMVAVLLQWNLSRFRFLRLAFLPVNIAVVASTFVLGYHYLADVGGGLVLGVLMLLAFDDSFRESLSRTRFRQGAVALFQTGILQNVLSASVFPRCHWRSSASNRRAPGGASRGGASSTSTSSPGAEGC